jgi:transposase
MAKDEEIPKTNPAEIEKLIEQIRGTNLEQSSKEKIERLLRTVLILVQLLQRKNMSIRKLREMIFGPRTEKHKRPNLSGEKKSETEEGESQVANQSNQSASGEQNSVDSLHKAIQMGHGQRAASDYSGAKVVKCRHQQLKAGDSCPNHLCGGRLYDLNDPTGLLQFTGQPLIMATYYEREVLRCAKCQDRYTALLPEGIKPERYDATCDATIALMKYGGGMPWYRQSALQTMCGVPLSQATMWERCEATADAALGIFLLLSRMAADGEVMHTDDTWVRILSCMKEDGKEQEKGRATNTSGIIVKVGERKVALYMSGRHHAGENLARILKMRSKGLDKPIQMSDALAANWIGEEEVIGAKCLVHGRRNVFELAEIYPAECQVVLDAIGKVYRYEAETAGMSKQGRLRHHQENSGPVMESLKQWIEEQFSQRLVEPNGSLGKALQYWLNHWKELTTWLREPGAPLDNNEVERALKQFILMRKNSLFFKTEHGASVGDILASLIMTCRLNGINAWEYLVTIVSNKAEARSNPHQYLPWTYKRDEAESLAA